MKQGNDIARIVGDQPPPSTVFGALKLGLRSSLAHPGLAGVFFAATLSQGFLQGLLVWALRDVLRRFGASHSVTTLALAVAALVILGLWILRSLSTYLGEVISARLAHKVEIASMEQVIQKLLTLSVRFFDKSSQGDLVMASYFDLKGVRAVTLDVGNVVLYSSRLLGLCVVAWLMSPKLAVIGLLAVPLGALPAYWLGHQITQAARQERDAVMSLYESFLEVTSGIRVIKVSIGESRVLQKAQHIGHALYEHVVRQANSRGMARLLMESVSGLGLIAVLTIGGRDVGNGTLDWQSLLSLLVAVMGGRLIVQTPAAFARWQARAGADMSLAQRGRALFDRLGCAGCHGGNAQGQEGAVRAPPLVGLYGRPVPLADSSLVTADDQYIHDSIMLPNKQVAAGYKPIMPPYGNVLDEEQVAQLEAYIRSLGAGEDK